MSDSNHDELGKVSAGRTMQLDALPEELLEGLAGEDSGYELADESPGPSLPPPLPPKSSTAPPEASEAGGSKRTMIVAIVVALLMAVAGVVVGTMVFGEGEAPAEPPPAIELGDIEVDSH